MLSNVFATDEVNVDKFISEVKAIVMTYFQNYLMKIF